MYLDWRVDDCLLWKKHDLPNEIATKILKFMSLMNLVFGHLDFRISPDGDYMFLEVNPSGQFLFLEIDDERLPISSAFADFLIKT
jgi:hypothetical protein